MPRVNDTRDYTAWEAVRGWPSAIFQIWEKHLQNEVIGDDRELATLSLKVR
jgi:hypothetical protein